MRAFLLPSLLFYFTTVAGQRVYELKDATVSHQLYSCLSYMADSPDLTFEEVIRRPFTTLDSVDAITKGTDAYWIKAEIRNETSFSHFVITLDQWSEASVYFKENEVWKNLVSGTHVPVSHRPLSLHRLLSFPLPIRKNEVSVIYMRVKYSQPILGYFIKLYSFPLKVEIDESSKAYEKYISVQLLAMFIVGVLTILFFYHLILFFFNKEKTSLILSCYLFVSALAIANSNGIATNYFFTQINSFELILGLLLGHAIPVIMAIFLVLFLKLTTKDWEFFLLFAFTIVVVISMLVSLFTHIQFLYIIRRYAVYLSFITVVSVSIVKRRPGAATLMVALLVTITTSYFAEFKSVFFKNITFTGPDKPYLVGVLLQMLILSCAATYRVRALQQGMQAMREGQRQLIQKQNDQLRIQLDKKTLQLRSALISLEQKKNQLESVNRDLSEKLHIQSGAEPKA